MESREEKFGIASAIVNNKNARGKNAELMETITDIAYAATDGNVRFENFQSSSPSQRNNDEGMTNAVAGAINVVRGGQDYSNGATGWDGRDLKSNSHRFGLNVTNPSHTNVPDNPLKQRENGSLYRRQTTASAGQTVFMRIHPSFVKGGGRAW